MKRAPDIMEEGAQTYRERNAIYGDNYVTFGSMMVALFPQGLTLSSVEDWNRMGIFFHMADKMTRYTAQWENGGHADSVHDLMVYSAMLGEIDNAYRDLRGEQPGDGDQGGTGA